MRRLLAAVVFGACCAAGAPAQEHAGRILDLIFKVEDLAGKVESLQVRETETETRIELPADILFDFDKADIRASAAPARPIPCRSCASPPSPRIMPAT